MAYYRHICQYGLAKFARFAENVWGVNGEGKTQEQIAAEGLDRMEDWMRELGLVMNIKDLGVTGDMIEGLAKSTLAMEGGYKVLTADEIVDVFKASMK